MKLENIKLDVDFVRSQFPAFEDPICKKWSFFENAGGSYVPQTVIKRLTNFMTSTKVQPYAEYPMAKKAGENMDLATKLFAKMINADGCHIGQKDIDFISCRKILGKNKIVGMTCHNSKKLALKAKKYGANYVAFGAFFKSSTKKTAFKANLEILRWAKKKINMPTVAIGGINNSNYKKILTNGANLIACSSYIWNNKKLDPVSAIKKFK